MPAKHPSIEQVHAALWKANGSMSEAARELRCTAETIRNQKSHGKLKGLAYPPIPENSFSRCPPDPTPEELIAARDAIRDGWSDDERAKRCVHKSPPVEVVSGLHPFPEEGHRAGRRPA